MSPAVLTNPFAIAGRLTKAFALAQFLRRHDVTSYAATIMTDDDWASVATAAGLKRPSAVTQQIALEKLAAMEQPIA